MKRKQNRKNHYTDDELIEMAREYEYVADLKKADNSLYTLLSRRSLLKKCDWLKKKFEYYTDEQILDTAHKYEYLLDFKKENYKMYQSAYRKKLDLSFLKYKVTKWTVETALAEAAKYETVSEFRKKGKGAAQFLNDNGLLEKCNFKRVLNPFTDNLENFVYGYFFAEQKACYIGRTCYLTARDWEHRNRKNDAVVKFAKKHNVEIPEYVILERGLTLDESSEKEGKWLEKYINDGWTPINRAKTGSIGGLGKKYPKKDIFEKARQFDYVGDFADAYPLEYAAASRRGLLKEMDWFIRNVKVENTTENKEKAKEMFKGLTRSEAHKKNDKYYRACNEYGWDEEIFGTKKRVSSVPYGYFNDIDNVRKEAAKYNTRREFELGCKKGYRNALKFGIIDELFPLEKPRHPRNSLTKEKCLEIFEFCGFSKVRLQEYDSSVYGKMLKNGWLEKEHYMTVDEALEIAKGCKSKKELQDNHRTAYTCLWKAGMMDKCGLENKNHPRSYYTYDVCKEIAMTCAGRQEFSKKNRLAYDISKENGWLDDFFPKATKMAA